MAPNLIFGAGGIGTTADSFTYTWDTPAKVSELLHVLQMLGIHELDSGASYPPGNPWNSETLLGASQAAKKGFIIDSKILLPKQGPSLNAENMAASIDRTCELLSVDKVRTLYAHMPDPSVSLREQAANFHQQFLEDKFERLGLSNYSAEQMGEYFEICEQYNYVKPSVYQGCYNALYRGVEKNLLQILRQHHCAFYAYSPLAGGFLTGKVTFASVSPDPNNLKRTRWKGASVMPQYQTAFDKPPMHNAIRRLEVICQEANPKLTLQEAALRWLVYHSSLQDCDGVIIGAKQIEQLKSNVADIRRGPLENKEAKAISDLWAAIDEVEDSLF
ncbi:NADP-dependent oxidoreductase domain-containing protein [Talaromyces proteolyticus]|uniref:NADP-dependent oxidoreductase domain-containing protein n=1 Tax=Talaromyces proteolyticus TaxID=1131652 RepID=A0AAD4KHB7_9EURO|nr:NADP-dependent oxidoreductase domain-containing protein [Talaromyces proteolyticus]KAH8690439.1 NADP-dependent oxidoreductase domain-containing protein [Talaromyces proteolyticus]